jgi:hypothetical protein
MELVSWMLGIDGGVVVMDDGCGVAPDDLPIYALSTSWLSLAALDLDLDTKHSEYETKIFVRR